MTVSVRKRISARVVAIAALGSTLVILSPGVASAAGTQLFDQPFHNNTADGDGAVVLPALSAGIGTNVACLSAGGNAGPAALHSCATATDAQGAGTLRLTDNTLTKTGGVFAAISVPTSQGLDVRFNAYQYGTAPTPADGLAFALSAVDPANPRSPANIGPAGGALGYSSAFTNVKGLAYAYMGFGFDVFGNFSTSTYQGTGCVDPPYISASAKLPGQVVVRGPGNNTVGYCGINSTATSATPAPPVVPIRATTRAASQVPVEVVVNPTATTFTTTSGLVVAPGTYQLVFTPLGQPARTLQGPLPTVPSGLFPASWVTAGGIPKQLAFGFVASTGSLVDFHEVDAARIVSLSPVPELTVAQTAYAQPTLVPGDAVSYTVLTGVQPGTAETAPISVTDTLPPGVVPVGGSGTGWVCQPPSGQQITCTNSSGPFPASSTLPTLTITGTVTTTGVTPAIVQSNSVVTASSTDSNPAYSSVATAGTPPAAPSAVVVTPATGPTGTPTVVTGLNLSGATAIEIGTAAELAAATGTTLSPCPGGVPAAGCFTVNGGGALVISSMPAHAVGAVQVKVVTLGAAGSGTFTYLSAPAAPTASATAGIASATVTWTLPATGGSPITGYVVTPAKDGVAQAPISVGPSPRSLLLSALTVKSSYTFTVAAVNLIGTGSPSAPTSAVIPYALPGAPVIGAATAGSSAATVSWTAPTDDGGRPVTEYVVTPYIGAAAQTIRTFVSTATTQIVTGLTPGTTYTFRVSAKNLAGVGPMSAASNAVTVNPGPTLAFPAPPAGQIGTAYSVQLTVSGGTAPFAWSVSAGTLPPGLTLGTGTGLLSGTPTTAGTSAFTVLVTDSYGQTAARPVSLVVSAIGATVQRTSSASPTRFGTAVTLTGTVAPADASGTIAFTDSVTSGPQAGTTVTLGTATVTGGAGALTLALPAFGANTIVATYSGDTSHQGATSTSTVMEVFAYAGEVLVNELRSSGPAGAADQYVELYNTGPAVPLSGLSLVPGAGPTIVLPAAAPTLGTGRSYLVAGSAFSLGGVATADLVVPALGTGGMRVLAPDTAATSTDAVGPSSGPHLGTSLPAMTGAPTVEHAWTRLETAGVPKSSGDNAADFALVSSAGGLVGGVQSMLGSASPTGLADPYQHTAAMQSSLLDPAVVAASVPNRVYVAGSPGRLEVRRTITNTSAATITAAKVRITSLSEANGPPRPEGVPATVALLRMVNPTTPTSDAVVAGRGPVTVQNLAVGPPIGGAPGGGLNSTATITLPGGGLVPGASVDVAFTFVVDTRGTYWFGYDVDTLG